MSATELALNSMFVPLVMYDEIALKSRKSNNANAFYNVELFDPYHPLN